MTSNCCRIHKVKRAIGLRWEKKPRTGTQLTHPGVYCLRTNQSDWYAERLWRTDILLTNLEAVFRSLKSELGLRPVYPGTDIVCPLALNYRAGRDIYPVRSVSEIG